MTRPPENVVRALIAAAALLLLAAVLWQGVATAVSATRAGRIERVAERWKPEKEGAPDAEQAAPAENPYASIAVAGFFGPPMPSSPPPSISAIIADTAILDGQEVRVGAMVGAGYKVVEILSNKVVVEKDGNKTDLVLFERNGEPANRNAEALPISVKQ